MKKQCKRDPRLTFPTEEDFGRRPRAEQRGVKAGLGRDAKVAQIFVLRERLDHRQNFGDIAGRGGQDAEGDIRIHGL